ncbi:hypothetical protein [Parahaliea aestuarii]|uniref:General secretion pathway protein GspK n=1 Tax=Parahaliea aestuarii TaxID=1852021 RepID=A0A5C8ZRT5_9GAMM|nr:hypothetical protein [Parahaliea aestuarii]TXS90071.1 hypothetical protein FVW59_15835 [Parahaliea aestuarii]
MRQQGSQAGVALAIVVWFLAAMSLLAAGIVYQAKVDAKLAQAHVARAVAVAAGDGAIQLMMARFTSVVGDPRNARGEPPLQGRFALGDKQVSVNLVPISGLVDVFNSPPQLLAALFVARGGLAAGDAKQLADNVVELRSPMGRRRALGMANAAELSSPEDLLKVPGFNRALLDAIYDDIRAVSGGSDSLNWAAMPETVLQALQGGGFGRIGSGARVPWSPRSETVFRVDAVVHYGDQRWLRRRWLRLTPGNESDLPWHPVRIEAPRALAKGSKGTEH